MKPVFIFFLATLIACNSADQQADTAASPAASQNAATGDSNNVTSIQWIDSVNTDLGKLTEGQVVEVSWRFKNTGDKPLVVQDVQAGCGCTVADRPKEPIAPGGEGVIKAKFDSKNQGPKFSKTVTVKANTKDVQTHYLTFSGEAIK